jgi:hypothetical protein
LPSAYPVEFRAGCLQRAEGGIDLIQKEILPDSLERLPQTEHIFDNLYIWLVNIGFAWVGVSSLGNLWKALNSVQVQGQFSGTREFDSRQATRQG